MSVAGISSSGMFQYGSVQLQVQSERVQLQLSGQGQPASLSITEERVELSETAGGNTSQPTSFSTSQPASSGSAADDFKALGQALQSGDLAGAQQAYATLQQDLQTAEQPAAGSSGSTSAAASGAGKLAQDFGALGQALQSGNLADAQHAYATVQQDAQKAQGAYGHHGHRHHWGGGQGAGSEVSALLNSLVSSQASGSSSESSSSSQAGSTSETGDSSTSGGPSSLAQEFSSLGQALQAGNLPDAQKAYAAMQQDFQNAGVGQDGGPPTTARSSLSMQFESISIAVTA
jgi:soluble cytochrome b562